MFAKMLEALVVTLREGIEAALVVGIVLAYLRRTGREDLRRYVFRGLWAALGVSLGGALMVHRLGIDLENELLEGTFMLVAAGLVGSLLFWMWRTARTLKQRIEVRLDSISAGGSGWGFFCFIFFMILREGVETVVFLLALSSTIGANALYNLVGGGLGLLLAFLFGFLLAKGSLRINLKSFFATTGFVLLLLVLKLIANGLHEFFEAGLLPSTELLLRLVGFLTRESTSDMILIALMLSPALSLLPEAWGKLPALDPGLPLPEQRRIKAEALRSKRWATAAASVSIGISYLLGFSLVAAAGRGYDPKPVVLPLTQTLRIPLKALDQQPMQKYSVEVNGVDVRFFVARNQEGKVAVALDACRICPLKGYFLDGEQVICHNCNAPIAFDTIGSAGGCNPMPLKAVIEKDEIVISAQALEEGRARFAREKEKQG